jgi:nucleoside-triphosphatase THEP1
MRLFLPPLEISETEGFTKENDIFGRAALGQGLTNLLTNVSDPVVIALDGQWGSGKTTFLKMWAGELRKAGFPVVYLDAFRNDYADDAFTALVSELIALANGRRAADSTKTKAFMEKAVGAGKVLLRSGLKLGVKAATLGALDAADLEKVADDIGKEVSELADKYVGELLTKQKEQKAAIQAFQDALEELPSLLLDERIGEANTKSLIVIVDELDRCRPVFALEMLERIKHFFSVPNVHFVLGAHIGQLSNSVKVAYGSDIDAQLYLQKFIQFTVYLIDGNQRYDQRAATKFIWHVAQSLDFKPEHQGLLKDTIEFVLHVAHSRDFSFRTIERIMTTIALALAFEGQSAIPPPLLGGLSILKNTDPQLFIKAKLGTLTFDEVRIPLAFYVAPDEVSKTMVEHGQDVWMYALNVQTEDGRVKGEYADFRRGLRLDGPKLLSFVANSVLGRLSPT